VTGAWVGLPELQLSPDAGGTGPGRQLDRFARRGLGLASYGKGKLICSWLTLADLPWLTLADLPWLTLADLPWLTLADLPWLTLADLPG